MQHAHQHTKTDVDGGVHDHSHGGHDQSQGGHDHCGDDCGHDHAHNHIGEKDHDDSHNGHGHEHAIPPKAGVASPSGQGDVGMVKTTKETRQSTPSSAEATAQNGEAAIDTSKANEECVGPSSEKAGKASGCEGCPNQKACADGAGQKEDPDLELIRQRLQDVRHKVLVLSGKGGVGKSTMSAQIAFALAAEGLRVGLLDIDICGPSIPHMLGLKGETVHQSGSVRMPLTMHLPALWAMLCTRHELRVAHQGRNTRT